MKLTMHLSTRIIIAVLAVFCFSVTHQTAQAQGIQNITNGYSGANLSAEINGTGDSVTFTARIFYDCPTSIAANNLTLLSNCGTTTSSLPKVSDVEISDVCATQTTDCGAGTFDGESMVVYQGTFPISNFSGCSPATFRIYPTDRTNADNLNNSASATSDRLRVEMELFFALDSTNTTPIFNANGNPYFCAGADNIFDPQVTETDGDSLVFSFRQPQSGSSSAGGSNIGYATGFSLADPINNGITIDSETGILDFTAPAAGRYQIVIEVEEYDRTTGNQISTVMRDFQFFVDSTCSNDGPDVATALSAVTNATLTSSYEVTIDTGSAASFALVFTGDAGETVSVSSTASTFLNGSSTSVSTASNVSTMTVNWTPTGADVGTHVFTINAEDNGCPIAGKAAQKVTVIVQESAQPFEVTGVTTSSQTCPDPANGGLTVSFTGGTGPYTFIVEGNFTGNTDTNSTGVFTALEFDVYRFYAIDSSTMDDTLSGYNYTVLQNILEVTGFTHFSDVSCDNECDGSLRVNRTGGITPYTYLWDNGETTRTAVSLCGGSSIVSVTDDAGCTVIDTAALVEPPAIWLDLDSSFDASCNGAADGEAYLTAYGGFAASDSTTTYVIDQTEGSFEPYGIGEAGNAQNYQSFTLGDDALTSSINIGFNFEFFGNTQTTFVISSNGIIQFPGATSGTWQNAAIPSATNPDNWVGIWDDLNPNAVTTEIIETYLIGSIPNRARVINYVNVPHFQNGSALFTFQIVLYETSNQIQIHATNIPSFTETGGFQGKTQGIENSDGSEGLAVTGRNQTSWTATNDFVAFIPTTQDFTYTWSSTGSGNSSTNLPAGTYTVTASDGGCSDTISFTIDEPTPIVIDTTVTNPSCVGDSNGSITASASGGNGGPFTYTWSTGATGATVNSLPAGTYTVTAEDNAGCTDSLTIVLTDPNPVIASIAIDSNVNCFGGSDGAMTASGAGGDGGPYSFLWSNGLTNASISGLTAGTYSVTVTDNSGCTDSTSATITEPATAVVAAIDTSTNVTCAGASDGQATASASGGTAGYSFAWSSGASGATATGLAAGTYIVTATDANGCTDTASVTITEPASTVNVSITSSDSVSCFGGNDGSATCGNATGGTAPYTYTWSSGATGQTATGLAAGTYTVTAEDVNGCTGEDSVTIFEPTELTVDTTSVTHPLCNGSSDGAISIVAAGGTPAYAFAWSNGSTSQNLTGLAAGTYTVTVTDNNSCTETLSVTLTNPPAIIASITVDSNASCNGATDGGLTASGTGGDGGPYTFGWSNGETTATIIGLGQGTYTVTVTDGNGCSDTTSATITEPTAVVASIPTSSNVSCLGGTDGSATAAGAGGTPNYSFSWNTGATTATIGGLTAATYSVTVTDANGCTDSASVVITEPATGLVVSIDSTSGPVCNGDTNGVIIASASSGTAPYSYAWSNGDSDSIANSLGAGTYTVTVTDNNGCTGLDSATLVNPPTLLAFANHTDPLCAGDTTGTASATGAGGVAPYSYTWNTGQTGSPITGLTAGTYTVTVTDANGCEVTTDETLSDPNSVTIVMDSINPGCGADDGQAWVEASNGTTPYIYAWNTGGTTDTISGLSAGTYTVTVTDDDGCSVSDSVTLIATPGVVATIGTAINPSCAGAATGSLIGNVVGGTGTLPFSYEWNTGSTSQFLTGLTAATYTLTVTDGNGCEDDTTVTLTDPAALIASIVDSTHESCVGNDGAAEALGTGGTGSISYAWNTGDTTAIITGLAAATYTVTVEDDNGCQDSATVIIDDTCACNGTLIVTTVTNVDCGGDSTGVVAAAVTGGSGPFTYAWSNGGSTDTLFNVPAGTYDVTVTYGAGCVDSGSTTVTEPTALTFTGFANINDPGCDDACDGTATAGASGGSGALTFTWSSGGNTAAQTGLCGGGHTVTVSDANGCEVVETVALFEPPSIYGVVDSTDSALCNGAANGAAYISGYGGTVAPTSTAAYVVDQTEGEFEPYPTGRPWNATNYKVININDDATSDTINIFGGSNFSFFGTNHTHFLMVSQGLITFDTTNANSGQVNGMFSAPTPIPSTAANTPSDFIAGYWNDLDPTTGNCTLETYLIGTTPNRVRVINYISIEQFGSLGNTSTFQIALYETSNIIQIHSDSLNSDGDGHVQGIENAAGTDAYAVPGRNDVNFSATNDYVAFIPTTQNFNYTWSSIGTGSSATNLTAGTYTVTIADGTCNDTVQFTIEEPPTSITASISSSTAPTCFGGSDGQAVVVPGGGTAPYSYSWSNGETADTAFALTAGTHTVTVTDANGCTNTAQTTLGNGTAINVSTTSTNSFCFVCTGTVTATVSGATGPYTYEWSSGTTVNSNSTTNQQSSLCSGPYSVTVTDANGCVDSSSALVNDLFAPNVTATATDATCSNSCDGEMEATYFCFNCDPIEWFVFPDTTVLYDTGDVVTGVCPGTYLAKITTAFGCSRFDTVVVGAPLPLVLDMDSVNAGCSGGASSGEASVSVTGGTSPYSYSWNTGDTTATITGLTAGTYSVIVTDSNSCLDTGFVTVGTSASLFATIIDSSDVSCVGGSDGSAEVQGTGGSGTLSYAWDNGETSAVAIALDAGLHCVTITDDSSCTAEACVTIDEPDSISISFTETAVTCTGGGSDGQLTASASGGTAGYTYSWSNGATGATITGLSVATYCVTVSDANGCLDSACYIMTPPGGLTVSIIDSSDVLCIGDANGMAVVQATGGSGNYTYAWSNGSTNDTVNNLSTGIATVTVTDGTTGCVDSASVNIGTPTLLVASIDSTVNNICFNGTDGKAFASASGGTPTYTYAWSNGSTADSAVTLSAGMVTVTVTDANGCTSTDNANITQPATGLSASAVVLTNAPCAGDSGTAQASGAGGSGTYGFIWSTGDTTAFVTLPAGTHSVTVTDGGVCEDSASVTITEPATLSVTLTETPITCTGGGNDGELAANVTGGTTGYNYSWNTGATSSSITGLTAGTYCVTVTDANNCTDTACFTLMNPTGITATIVDSTDVACFGDLNGGAVVQVTGGTGNYTYSWSNGATTDTVTNLSAGLHGVTVTDTSTGCQDSTSVNIGTPTVLTASIDSTVNNQCFNGADGKAFASGSGGTLGYTYAWSNGSVADSAVNLSAGMVYVTITDANGCTAVDSADITQPATGLTASITQTNDPLCNGDSATLVASGTGGSGTYTFIWNTGDTTASIDVPAGNYEVTVSDGGVCEDSASITVTDPDPITATAVLTSPGCPGGNDGEITVSAMGGTAGYTYLWFNGSTNPTITGLTAGTYGLTITDANLCQDSTDITLTDPLGMSATFSNVNPTACGACNGSATIAITGGAAPYSYQWPSGSTGTTGTNLCAGINFVTVTDDNNCTDSFSIAIPNLGADSVTASVVNNTLCNGDSTGSAAASYICTASPCVVEWFEFGQTTVLGTADTVTGLWAGDFVVELTNDSGCVSYDTITITEPTPVVASVDASTNVSCLGGSDGTATASGSGGTPGYTFLWDNGQTSATATGLNAGTHCVTVTDANGCEDTACVNITEPATGLSVVASQFTAVDCNGANTGSAIAVVSGGSGTYSYSWTGTSQINDTVTGLTAGTYTVTVSDGGSCTAIDTVLISEPSAITVTVDSINHPTCPGDSNGFITVSASGGTPGYTFAWPSGGTGQTEMNLPDGTYCVTVTDANNCQTVECIDINDPAGMTITFSNITGSGCTVCDGTATADVTGGNGSTYTYLWDNGQTTDSNNALCAGFSNVTVTDSLGCTATQAVLINADGADSVTASGIDANCGSCDGEVYATYNCTSAPCTVEWTIYGTTTVIGTTDTVTGLCPGTYAVELTNGDTCVSVDTFTVGAPDLIDPNAAVTNVSCFGLCNGSIVLSPTGGSGTYSYTWSNGNTTNSNTGLCPGNYTVTVDDGSGCDTVMVYSITEPTQILLNEAITHASCAGECDGSILLSPSGGAGSYSVNWSPVPSNGNGSVLADSLCAGDHMVTVTDIDGCSVTDTFTITEPDAIVQDTVQVTDATCGDCDGEITASYSGGAGGYTFAWSNGETTQDIDSLCFGYYEVTVTDADGCTNTFGHPVSETNGPDITLSGTNATAQGACDGTATATVTSSLGTVTFMWSNGDNTATADSLCAGMYIVTATDTNGCSTVDTITITEPTELLLDFDVEAITCQGNGCDGEIEAIVTGGTPPYTYAWSNGDTTAIIDSLCQGTYVLTLTDFNGQVLIDSVVLDGPSPFTITQTVVDASCNGECDGEITLNIASGGAPYTLIWSTGDTTETISNLCAGMYGVTVTDTAGCADSLSIAVNEPTAITITIDSLTNPDCQMANGMIGVTASGGNGGTYSYLWLDVNGTPLIPTQNTQVATNLAAGIYNVEVIDSNGCTDTLPAILNNANAPTITLDSIHDVSCFGECDGMIEVTVSGGVAPVSILWSTGTTAEDDTALCAGPDTIAVSDANLCLAFDIYEVGTPDEIEAVDVVITDVVCGADCDGQIDVSIAGGTAPYTFAWSTGETDSTITDLCSGTYGLTVTDANGCTMDTNFVVGGPTPMSAVVDSTTNATCTYTGDGSVYITVSGGAAPYTYLWIHEDGDSLTNEDLVGVLSGEYVLIVTDTLGCEITDTFEIDTENYVEVDAGEDLEVCPFSNEVQLNGSGEGEVSSRWLNENGTLISDGYTGFVNTEADSTYVILEGINGICVDRDTMLITWFPGPGLDAGPDQFMEPGESVTIGGSPTAPAGIEFTWSPNEDISGITEENPTVNPLETTTYYLFATDPDGCFGIDSVLITVEKVIDPVGGFSPNGDGVNDEFIIDRIEKFPNAVVQIFNRWGNPIFESSPGYTTPWNGKFNGKQLPVGTYYYIIDLKDDEYKDKITGPVTILK